LWTGWEKISVRKKVKKLMMFYKIVNHQAWFELGGWGAKCHFQHYFSYVQIASCTKSAIKK
jgi:hypothetical protein